MQTWWRGVKHSSKIMWAVQSEHHRLLPTIFERHSWRPVMDNLSNLKIKLTPEEKDILRGAQDPVMQKIMKTVVLYGEALNDLA